MNEASWIIFVVAVVAGYYAVTWAAKYVLTEIRREQAETAERESKKKSRAKLVEEVWEIDEDFKLKLRALREMELPDDAREVWETKLINQRINELGRRILGRRK